MYALTLVGARWRISKTFLVKFVPGLEAWSFTRQHQHYLLFTTPGDWSMWNGNYYSQTVPPGCPSSVYVPNVITHDQSYPSEFPFCKWSKTGGRNSLGTMLRPYMPKQNSLWGLFLQLMLGLRWCWLLQTTSPDEGFKMMHGSLLIMHEPQFHL